MTKSNLLLESLPAEDAAALKPFLKFARLEPKTVLFEPGECISAVYFPAGAVISLVVGLASGKMIEAAMVGKDGVVGASCALDSQVALTNGVVQLAGDCFICDVKGLKSQALQHEALLSKLIRHDQILFAQAQQSAACMAAHGLEARLCRWLLRARDLSDSDMLPFTQEYLAEMLGVRRGSVTEVALTLQKAGAIEYRRGNIQIVDAEVLRRMTCECHEAVKSHYEVLLRN
jgi:CRP-like cAMP-binding protein